MGGAIVGLIAAAALQPQLAIYNWKVMVAILAVAGPILVYLWINPLLLPLSAFSRPRFRRSRPQQAQTPSYKREQLEVDAILEKVSKVGVQGLSEDERDLLEQVSGKYQRRTESKKPESGLAI